MRDIKDISLQSLIVTKGWKISYNSFYDLEPAGNLIIKGAINDNGWTLFDSTLLQASNDLRSNITLDLGWSPPTEPDGMFKLQLIKDYDWQNPLASFNTRSKDEVVAKINELLMKVTKGEIK